MYVHTHPKIILFIFALKYLIHKENTIHKSLNAQNELYLIKLTVCAQLPYSEMPPYVTLFRETVIQ